MNPSRARRAMQQTVARYVPGSRHFQSAAPTLASSLAVFSESGGFASALAGLPADAACLMMGCCAPANVEALRAVLARHGVTDPSILIIDRLPIPDIYADLGLTMPGADFLQIDACAPGDSLAGRSFDLIVQDFVLNCMPPAQWPALLRSTRALLAQDGLALISLSTDARPTGAPAQPLRQALPDWPDDETRPVWSIADLAGDDADHARLAADLTGKALIDERTGHIVQVTAPAGFFEFFALGAEVDDLFRQAGLTVTSAHRSVAVDYSGLACTRQRLIVAPG